MASDTSLVFRLVPVDQGVGAMMARTAMQAQMMNKANKAAAAEMSKTAGEANKLAAALENAAKRRGGLAGLWASFRQGGADFEKTGGQVNKTFQIFEVSAKQASKQIGDLFQRMGDSAGRGGRRTIREFFKIDNAMRHTARRWASIIALIGLLIIALIGHTVAFVHAASQVVGVLAAVPAVAFAAAVGLGALFAIFKNLPAAMQKTAGGARTLDQVAAATRRHEIAQRSAADAQRNLNDARAEAARRLADVSRELTRARLDEEGAILSVAQAQRRLREARASGDRFERAEADLALRQSVQTLDDIRLRIQDLKAEEADRAEKGIEGSDEVQQALRRQSDALYELAEAQQALRDAQTDAGAPDAAAEAYAKLSQAGKDLVDTLKSLGDPWRVVQQEMQQAALVGVAQDVQGVSNVLLGQKDHLVGIAAGWNTAFRGMLGYFQSTEGAEALNKTLGNTAIMSQHLGAAWEPFTRGFMTFVEVGSEFLPRLGQWIEKLGNDFADWAQRSADSGKITQWIENGIEAAKNLGVIIRDISGGIGAIFRAGSGGEDFLANLADSATRWRETMASPEMQEQLANFFAASRDLGSSLWVVIKSVIDAITQQPDAIKAVAGALSLVGTALKFAADHGELLNAILPPLISAFILYKSVVMGVRLAVMLWTTAAKVKVLWLGLQKVGLIAVRIATVAMTIAQRALNIAMMLGPWGLIVLAIAAVVGAFIWLWNNVEGFRNFFIEAWDKIWGFLKGVGDWIVNDFVGFFLDAWQWIVDAGGAIGTFFTETIPGWLDEAKQWIVDKWNGIIDWFKGLPGKIGDAAKGMWDGIKEAFKAMMNVIIGWWNNFEFTIPAFDVVPGVVRFDGLTVGVPDIPPLATGGTATSAGLALVGERGPELVSLPRGASVIPLQGGLAGGTDLHLYLHVNGPEIVKVVRYEVRARAGNAPNSVQVALG